MRHSEAMSARRNSYRNAIVVTALLAVCSATALSQSGGNAPADPMQVTTDTPQYCDHLAGRVAQARLQHPNAVPEVQSLAEEGRQMCNSGLIRGGLVRLRRALLLLEHK